ncbi:MAG: hypothetical protein NVV63_04880 [Opitutus sp.]|nr:hypothetical protein [Opitutus sp.]
MSSTSPSSPAPKTQARGRPRRWLWLGALALAVLIVLGLWPKPLPVETAVVSRGELVVSVSEEGMTRVRNRYVISAPVSGQLRRIDWKAGAPVRAGDTPLAVLETSGADFLDTRTLAQAEARVRGAEAAREAALAQRQRAAAAAKLATADYERAQKLFFARSALPAGTGSGADARDRSAAGRTRGGVFAARGGVRTRAGACGGDARRGRLGGECGAAGDHVAGGRENSARLSGECAGGASGL